MKFGIKSAKILNTKVFYNEKYLRTKIKFYEGKTKNFQDIKISKNGSQYIRFSVILINININSNIILKYL